MFCFGCMKPKTQRPVCEHCGYDERQGNLVHQLPLGTILQGQYTVGRVLGQGGFGITYIGWDNKLQTPVAIKEYFPNGIVHRTVQNGLSVSFYSGDDEAVFRKHLDRFLKEARTLAQFTGTQEVVQVRNFFEENRTAYIVMEYVDGITLKKYLRDLGRPLSVDEALIIMEPVVRALAKVHEKQLVHRDISPDNIMLPKDGGIKLIDFGTVRYLDGGNRSKSTESILKPGFAPLEQYNTRGNIGTWTDVYALCATFYYCMTGKLPPDAPSRIEEGEELPLLKSIPGISSGMVEGLKKGMTIRVADRVSSVEELHTIIYTPKSGNKQAQYTEKQFSGSRQDRKSGGKFITVAVLLAIALTAGIFLRPGKSDKTQNGEEVQIKETQAAVTQPPQEATDPVIEIQESIAEDSWEMEPIPEVSVSKGEFVRLENSNGYDLIGENLLVRINKDREFIITIDGLTIEDSYLVNWEGCRKDTSAYMWTVSLHAGVIYEVVNVFWNFEPGNEEQITIDEMSHDMYMYNPETESFEYVNPGNGTSSSVITSMTHTDSSITWTGWIPESYPFDIMDVEQIDVSYSDDYLRLYTSESYHLR